MSTEKNLKVSHFVAVFTVGVQLIVQLYLFSAIYNIWVKDTIATIQKNKHWQRKHHPLCQCGTTALITTLNLLVYLYQLCASSAIFAHSSLQSGSNSRQTGGWLSMNYSLQFISQIFRKVWLGHASMFTFFFCHCIINHTVFWVIVMFHDKVSAANNHQL